MRLKHQFVPQTLDQFQNSSLDQTKKIYELYKIPHEDIIHLHINFLPNPNFILELILNKNRNSFVNLYFIFINVNNI